MFKKVLVVGLDGVPFSLLEDYISKGALPNFARILSGGLRLRRMDASVPDVSSTSWTSFMTGVNPAEHGIYGFMELRPGTYSLYFPTAEDIKAPSVWEIGAMSSGMKRSTLSEGFAGRFKGPVRSVVMNVPQTYPAAPMNGVLTAGFVCPDLKKGTYPESAYRRLVSMGYVPDVDANKAVEDREAFFKEVRLSLEKRLEASLYFMKNEQWDLFVSVVTETDRVHHFFYDAAMDPSHALHGVFLDVYSRIDSMVGSLYDAFMEMTGGDGVFLTMSDHGFTPIKTEVYLNAWLREKGYLTLDPGREYYDQIASGSRAFCMDPARIYLNLKGKYPRGSVEPSERAQAVAELKAELSALKGPDGGTVVREIFERDEIYNGPLAPSAPDIVCIANDGYDLKGNLKRPETFGRSAFRGMHTRHDAHCIAPAGLGLPDALKIEDLAPCILEGLIKG